VGDLPFVLVITLSDDINVHNGCHSYCACTAVQMVGDVIAEKSNKNKDCFAWKKNTGKKNSKRSPDPNWKRFNWRT